MSSDHDLDPAAFEPASRDQWEAAAEKALRGRPLVSLDSTTSEGIVRSPLYTREMHSVDGDEAGVPGAAPYTRGASAAGSVLGWEIRQTHDAAAVGSNEAILRDLERGVTGITLADSPDDVDALDAVLDGLYLDLAPVHLAPGSTAEQRQALIELAARRDVPASSLTGCLGADPIGTLARTGALDTSLEEAMATVSAGAGATGGPSIAVDGSVFADAGASDAHELAACLASGVAWLRALTAGDHGLEDAARQLEFTLAVGPDQFLSIAKLRAARTTWSRVLSASGIDPAQAPMAIHATSAAAMMTQRDPWVNMLRTTMACFSSAVGGADAVTIQPFDSALGASDELGLRVARNTQLILREETQAARVIDPAGGSWYVEDLSRELALAAWTRFQEIEAAGGIGAALTGGTLQAAIAESRQGLLDDLASRRHPITGVSEFPDINETALERTPKPSARHTASGGASCEPLPTFRWAEPFEDLRDAAEASGTMSVFLANLGSIAVHTARATFAKNLFEVGGIEALSNDGFDTALDAAKAFGESGSPIACICSSDAMYADLAAATARELKAAGARLVYLAGAPGESEAELRAAGIDGFIHMGCDVLAVLREAHAGLG